MVSLSQNEYVLLIDVEESQRFSQDSHVSVRSSQRSEIEKNHPAPTILEEDEEDEEEFEPDPAGPGRPGGTKGRLDECKDRQMKDRSKDIFQKMVRFCNEEGMNMWEFLGIQGKRHYSDKSNREEYSLEKGKMSSSSAEVANSTSSSSGNEAKNGNAPQGTETKSNEKLQGEKRSHDNSGN